MHPFPFLSQLLLVMGFWGVWMGGQREFYDWLEEF